MQWNKKHFNTPTTLRSRDRILDLSEPVIMGVINMTPDSYFSPSRINSRDALLERVNNMINAGAAIIDIGGMSTRPGAKEISEEQEIKRVVPSIEAIRKAFPNVFLSIDTYRSTIAKRAVEKGVDLINDISGGEFDPEIWNVAATFEIPYVLMHMQGTPVTMQKDPRYENVVVEVMQYLMEKAARVKEKGVHEIIIDPGFGFGKTIDHNYELLKSLHLFSTSGFPVLVGISRKSMITRYFNISAQETLPETSALHLYAIFQGAKILRVHDVAEAKRIIGICKKLHI